MPRGYYQRKPRRRAEPETETELEVVTEETAETSPWPRITLTTKLLTVIQEAEGVSLDDIREVLSFLVVLHQ